MKNGSISRTILVAMMAMMVGSGCGEGALEKASNTIEGELTAVAGVRRDAVKKFKMVTRSNGAFASLDFIDPQSAVGVLVRLAQSADTSEIAFYYNAYYNDPTSQVCTEDPVFGTVCNYTRQILDFVGGYINAADVNITNRAAILNTDFFSYPEMIVTRCVVDGMTATTDCNQIPPSGIVNLKWVRTNYYYTVSDGSSKSKFGNTIIRTTGKLSEFSAAASGTVVGKAYQNAPGVIGTESATTTEVTRE